MARNPLREAWAAGRTTFGLWSVMPGTIGAEILAQAGADYVCVDQQHGVIEMSLAIGVHGPGDVHVLLVG